MDLPVTKSGRSLQLNNSVREGLPYIQKSQRRYFFEQDVIDFLWRTPRSGRFAEACLDLPNPGTYPASGMIGVAQQRFITEVHLAGLDPQFDQQRRLRTVKIHNV